MKFFYFLQVCFVVLFFTSSCSLFQKNRMRVLSSNEFTEKYFNSECQFKTFSKKELLDLSQDVSSEFNSHFNRIFFKVESNKNQFSYGGKSQSLNYIYSYEFGEQDSPNLIVNEKLVTYIFGLNIGNIFFLDYNNLLLTSLYDSDIWNKICGNTIIIPDLDDASIANLANNPLTMTTIGQMLQHDWKEKTVFDLGSKHGLLSLVALKLQAKRAYLFEFNPKYYLSIQILLNLNGFKNYTLHEFNIKNNNNLKNAIQNEEDDIIVISNHGENIIHKWKEDIIINSFALSLSNIFKNISGYIFGEYTVTREVNLGHLAYDIDQLKIKTNLTPNPFVTTFHVKDPALKEQYFTYSWSAFKQEEKSKKGLDHKKDQLGLLYKNNAKNLTQMKKWVKKNKKRLSKYKEFFPLKSEKKKSETSYKENIKTPELMHSRQILSARSNLTKTNLGKPQLVSFPIQLKSSGDIINNFFWLKKNNEFNFILISNTSERTSIIEQWKIVDYLQDSTRIGKTSLDGSIRTIAIDHNEKILAFAPIWITYSKPSIQFFDIRTLKRLDHIFIDSIYSSIESLDFSPTSNSIVNLSGGHHFEIQTIKKENNFYQYLDSPADTVIWSNIPINNINNYIITISSLKNTLEIRSIPSMKIVHKMSGHHILAINHFNDMIITKTEIGININKLLDGDPILKIEEKDCDISDADFHPTNQLIAHTCDRDIKIYNIISGKKVELIGSSSDTYINKLKWSPDGNFIATSNYSQSTINLWPIKYVQTN